jgi:hypothetical protein
VKANYSGSNAIVNQDEYGFTLNYSGSDATVKQDEYGFTL